MDSTLAAQAPQALRSLVSWQAGRVATIGARLTARRMPLESRSDFAVLACLAEYGDQSQADICRILGLDRNNVNGIVTRLEQRGQVQRQSDASDRRRNIVTLTDAGRVHQSELEDMADAVQAELLQGLSATEKTELVALLSKVLAQHPAQPA